MQQLIHDKVSILLKHQFNSPYILNSKRMKNINYLVEYLNMYEFRQLSSTTMIDGDVLS